MIMGSNGLSLTFLFYPPFSRLPITPFLSNPYYHFFLFPLFRPPISPPSSIPITYFSFLFLSSFSLLPRFSFPIFIILLPNFTYLPFYHLFLSHFLTFFCVHIFHYLLNHQFILLYHPIFFLLVPPFSSSTPYFLFVFDHRFHLFSSLSPPLTSMFSLFPSFHVFPFSPCSYS